MYTTFSSPLLFLWSEKPYSIEEEISDLGNKDIEDILKNTQLFWQSFCFHLFKYKNSNLDFLDIVSGSQKNSLKICGNEDNISELINIIEVIRIFFHGAYVEQDEIKIQIIVRDLNRCIFVRAEASEEKVELSDLEEDYSHDIYKKCVAPYLKQWIESFGLFYGKSYKNQDLVLDDYSNCDSDVETYTQYVEEIRISTKPIKSPFVFFLDIDGVLNNHLLSEEEIYHNMKILFPKVIPSTLDESKQDFYIKKIGTFFFNTVAIKNLENVIVKIAKFREVWVVISSNWRKGKTPQELFEVFDKHTFHKFIVGKTPDSLPSTESRKYCNSLAHLTEDMCCRAAEIVYWLKQHPYVTEFAVLDDLEDKNHLACNFGSRFFQTNINDLLTEEIGKDIVYEYYRKPNYLFVHAYSDISSYIIRQTLQCQPLA